MPSRNLPFSSYAVKILIPLIFMIDNFFFLLNRYLSGALLPSRRFLMPRACVRVKIYLQRGLNHELFGSLTA